MRKKLLRFVPMPFQPSLKGFASLECITLPLLVAMKIFVDQIFEMSPWQCGFGWPRISHYLAISVSFNSLDFNNSSEAMACLITVSICALASPIRASRWTSAVLARPRDWKSGVELKLNFLPKNLTRNPRTWTVAVVQWLASIPNACEVLEVPGLFSAITSFQTIRCQFRLFGLTVLRKRIQKL